MKATFRTLDRFFFEFSSPVALAAFRWMFGAVLLIDCLLRVFQQPAIEHYLMVIAIVLGTIGPFGRIGSRLVWTIVLLCQVLYLSSSEPSGLFEIGSELVSTFWILGLCLTDSSERWSIRARRLKLSFEPRWSRALTSVGMRWIQISLCFIYVCSGFSKLRGLDQVSTDVSAISRIVTWAIILFEVYAPVFFWSRAARKWTLMCGWLLSIGIALTTGAYVFSAMLMSAYFIFVDSRWLESTFMRGKVTRFGLRF